MPTLEGYRLSPQQTALHRWSVSPDGAACRTTALIAVDAPLDRNRLEQALRRLWERWEILRTRYHAAAGGQPVQVIEPAPATFDFDSEGEPVSLQDGPDGGARIRFMLPASTVDAASVPPLVAELAALYADPAAPEPADEERVQYLQYAEYGNEWRGGDEHAELQARWEAARRDMPGPLWLVGEPAVRFEPRRAVCSLHGDVRETSAKLGVSPRAALYAAWQALLLRWSGEGRFRLDLELHGRSYEELGRLPGPFSAWQPDIVDLNPRLTFADLARRTEERLLRLDELFEGGPFAGEPSSVGFSFTDATGTVTGDGMRWRLERLDHVSSPFHIRLNGCLYEHGSEVAVEWNARSADAEPVGRALATAFRALWASAAGDSSTPIHGLELLDVGCKDRIVRLWNPERSSPTVGRPVHQRIEEQARLRPEAVAVRTGSEEVSFGELNARANRLARDLRRLGAGPESVVGVYGERTIDALTAILATLKSGAAYLPLDPALPSSRLARLVESAGAAIVVADREPAGDWTGGVPRLLMLGELLGEFGAEPAENLDLSIEGSSLAYVLYTSGSTGEPKGVAVEHDGLASYLDWVANAYGAGKGGAPLHSSLAFDLSVTSLFGPLAAGQTVRLADGDDPVEALSATLAGEGGFDWIKLTPSHARIVGLRLGSDTLRGRTRLLIVGGEALQPEHLSDWVAADPDLEIVNEYGPTEAVVGCCVQRFRVSDADSAELIGRPIDSARIYLCDPWGGLTPPGVVGEMLIGGPGLARGYLGQSAATAERFVPDPFSGEPGARLYRTGDLARRRDDGALEYLGRLDEQIKHRGYRIEPAEIEAALQSLPGVGEAAVVLAGEGKETRLAGYFTASDEHLSFAELRRAVAEKLPEYMVPSTLVRLAELPLTPNGKVDRAALRDTVVTTEASLSGPCTLEEETLTQIWARVLGVEGVGVEDDYFTLGGDSIRAIEIVGQAEQRGIRISLNDLFKLRTIRVLARAATASDGAAPLLAPEPFCLAAPSDHERLPADAVDAYPLSALQAGMIFHREYHAESAIYHDIFGYRLRMPLEVEKLTKAAEGLVERHPNLRTAFALRGFSEPLQLVRPEAPGPLHVTDLRGLSEDEQEAEIDAWMESEKHRGFDYMQPPLLRFQVHIRSDEDFQFSLSFHHAILDGWSDASMLVELAVSYQHLLEGREIPFQAPKTLYREFIALERRTLDSPQCRQYWADKLKDATPLMLPRWTGASNEAAGPRGVRSQVVPIAPETSAALSRIARELAVPLKSVLLAAHMRVMAELGGAEDVVSSLSSAGRPETLDANDTLGLHLNSTPVRLRLGSGSWNELILDAFEQEREALPYRRFPLAEIQRLTASRRLTETSFYYTHYHNVRRLRELPRFEILGRKVYEETSFTLVANFNLDPFDQSIALTLACDQTQLDASLRQWVGDYYEQALLRLATDPAARYETAELMTPAERERLLAVRGASLPANPESPLRLFENHARRNPDAIAVSCGEDSLTYGELDRMADHIAARLARLGAGPGERVCLSLERGVLMAAAILGTLKAGAAYVPIDPANPEERQELIVQDARPAALLVDPPRAEAYERFQPAPVVVLDREELAAEQGHEPIPRLGEMDRQAYVIYTSGSTGKPKGVTVLLSNLAASTAARLERYDKQPSAYLLLSSYAFDSSVAGIFWTWATGGELVLPAGEEHRDPAAIVRLLQDRRVSHTLAIPSLYREILETAEGLDLPSLQTVIVAGEACPAELVRMHFHLRPQTRLYNEYGPTEATVWCTVQECGPHDPEASLIGAPIPGTRVHVLDARGRMVPAGVRGELCVTGPGLAPGYLDRPALTADAFRPNPFAEHPGERLYRTGDAVRLRPEGTLEFLGRVDQQVKIRGHRVELGEIEAAVRRVSAAPEAVVVAAAGPAGGLRLIAYLARGGSIPADQEAVLAGLRKQLPEPWLPAAVVFLDVLPKTANGKVDRRKLVEMAESGVRPETAYLAPRNAMEETLCTIWAETLKVERVGVLDDFFGLGGDSILSIRIIARARDAGLAVSPLDLFQGRTVAALAEAAAQVESAPQQPCDAGSAAGAVETAGVSEADLERLLKGRAGASGG